MQLGHGADCSSKVTLSNLPLAQTMDLVAVTWKPTDVLCRIALWICRYILYSLSISFVDIT
jgi:hypothetical protein